MIALVTIGGKGGERCIKPQVGFARLKDPFQVKFFAVETWNCGTTELYCPRCQKSTPPLVRKQRNKVPIRPVLVWNLNG